MSLFRRKTDPLHERARELNEQINALEAEIRRLHHAPPPAAPAAPAPSVVRDHTPPPRPPANTRRSPHFARSTELVLEEVQQSPVAAVAPAPHEHRNELGVRKLDLASLFGRVTRQFRGPAASNPKLVSYLAAGSIQGLRPLRYEKRIARNRFIVASILLFACLWGLLAIILRQY